MKCLKCGDQIHSAGSYCSVCGPEVRKAEQDASPLDDLVMPNQDRTPPNPGSDAALDRGCTCPVLDNGHGRINGGKGPFWITANCPLHTA